MTVNMNGHSHPEPHCLGCIFTRSSEEIETHTKGKLPGYNESVSEALKQVNVQYDEKIENIVYNSIDSISDELREISVDLHENPEIGFEEFHAHAVLTTFLEKKGFKVTKEAFGIKTAFMAEFSQGEGKRVGVCSEYDALPGLGQGCGHNLIAISGLATAIAIKTVLESGKANGKVVLFGTPSEENTTGKLLMLQKRAFQDNVDVCLMVHPAAIHAQYAAIIAVHNIEVEFFGTQSHAGAAPWAGVNALDAAVQTWNNVSMMRQQLKPTDRVHGIITNGGQAPNIIPGYTSVTYYIRTHKASDADRVIKKLEGCIKAAALATGCEVKYKWREVGITKDVIHNNGMADVYASAMQKFGVEFPPKVLQEIAAGGSTDFGNVSYEMPCIHPMFGIHTNAANHTVEFTAAAKTVDAHNDTIMASKALALTGVEVLINQKFYDSIQLEFKNFVSHL